jgi:hypothetical protein
MDARIRDDNSIRTTNAKLTIESLKNLAKERDLMIDKRMNEKRYASGGTVNLAQGDEVYSPPEPFRGEFFEEFLRGRGGREAFQEGDFLERLLAKIGGGRTRTQDEMIADTYESYKFDLRDSDSLEDNLRYQAIIEDEEKRRSTTPTVDSNLDRVGEAEQFLADDFSDGLGKSVERIPDPNAKTFVPEGSVDLEVDPRLDSDVSKTEEVEFQGLVPVGPDVPVEEEPKTLLQKMKPKDNDGPRPEITLEPEVGEPIEEDNLEGMVSSTEIGVDSDKDRYTDVKDFSYGPMISGDKQTKQEDQEPEPYVAPKPPVIIDNKGMRDEVRKQQQAKDQKNSMISGVPEPGSVDDKGILDTVSEWWANVSIAPNSWDARPLSEVFPKKEVQARDKEMELADKEVPTLDSPVDARPNIKDATFNSIMSYEGFNPNSKGYPDTNGIAYGSGLNFKFLKPNQKDEIIKATKGGKKLPKKINDKIVKQRISELEKNFRKDMKGSNVTFGKLNPARKAALVNMGFNMGFGKTAGKVEGGFTEMYKHMKNGEFEKAADNVLFNFDKNGKKIGKTEFYKRLPDRAENMAKQIRDGIFYNKGE